MPLTKEDIERIEALGYVREYFVVEGKDGIPRLRNINGHCVFLDTATGKCRIYQHRPLGCRLYPLVYVPGRGVDIDPLCPMAYRIPRSLVKRYEKHVLYLVKRIYGSI